METNDFKDAKVGDRVCDLFEGWGEIDEANLDYGFFRVCFDKSHEHVLYKLSGIGVNSSNRTLFLDEVKIVPPPKPKNRVKKVIEGWANIYQGETLDKKDVYFHFHESRDMAVSAKGGNNALGEPYPIKHEYWEDEIYGNL